jgi:PilZ domain
MPGPLPSLVLTSDGPMVCVAPPCVGGVAIPLPLNHPFRITYRAHGVPCEIPAVLVQAPSGPSAGYLARLEGPVTRRQRRHDVRIPVNLPVAVVVGDPAGELTEVSATAVDASVGGLQLTSEHLFALGDALQLGVSLHGLFIRPTAVVVRVSTQPGSRIVSTGVRFVELDSAERRRLMSFLLDRQRALRRRELGLE